MNYRHYLFLGLVILSLLVFLFLEPHRPAMPVSLEPPNSARPKPPTFSLPTQALKQHELQPFARRLFESSEGHTLPNDNELTPPIPLLHSDPDPLNASTNAAHPSVIPLLSEHARSLPPSGMEALDDLEAQDPDIFQLHTHGNPTSVELVTFRDPLGIGRTRLAWELAGGTQPKSFLRFNGPWTLFETPLSSAPKFELVIHNSSKGTLKLNLALSLTEDEIWNEAPPQEIAPGWNKLVFDLAASDFKNEASGWRSAAALERTQACLALNLCVLHFSKPARLTIEGLRFVK
jgi:hypothetical protein